MPRPALAAVLAAGLAVASSCSDGRQSGGGQAAGIGGPAPAYQGKTLDDRYVALSDYQGQVVLLNVWATWCGPCRKELPELAALQGRYGSQGFTVLGVSVDRPGAKGQVKRMADHFGLTYPIVLDPDGSGLSPLQIRGYPTSFLIGRDGTLLWRRDGIIEAGEGELAGEIEAALGG